jgi:hypothetical protein
VRIDTARAPLTGPRLPDRARGPPRRRTR